jgi:hypothetical protein
MAPQIDGMRQEFQAGKHRAAGGGQARRRLEVGRREIDGQVIPQRDAGDGRQCDPGQRDQHQSVARFQLAPEAARAEPEQRAQHKCRHRGDDEGPKSGIELPHRHDERRKHGHGEHHHHQGEYMRDRQ